MFQLSESCQIKVLHQKGVPLAVPFGTAKPTKTTTTLYIYIYIQLEIKSGNQFKRIDLIYLDSYRSFFLDCL